MELSFTKHMNGWFKPTYGSDHESAKKIKVGEPYLYKCNKPRNYQFHKKYFALVNMVFENQERYTDINHLRADLTIEAGFYTETPDLHGTMIKRAKSIRFDKMDQFEFDSLYEKTIDVICQHFHFERQDIIENLVEFF